MGMTGAGGAPSSDVESKRQHKLGRVTVGCGIYTRNLITAKSRTYNQNILVPLAKSTNHLLHAHNKHWILKQSKLQKDINRLRCHKKLNTIIQQALKVRSFKPLDFFSQSFLPLHFFALRSQRLFIKRLIFNNLTNVSPLKRCFTFLLPLFFLLFSLAFPGLFLFFIFCWNNYVISALHESLL